MTIEIGAKIKQLRVLRSLTQEEVGNTLGVSAQAVSKWESGLTMPDIQLLPEIAVLFGVSIDDLFSMTDESRLERIENMLTHVRFVADADFADAQRFLKEKMGESAHKPRAALLMAALLVKRAKEYQELAVPVAREALWLNPDEKWAHNTIFDAEGVPCRDWNEDNRWELIDFYKTFLRKHPDNFKTYGWLLDLLCESGRASEIREYAAAMDGLHHSFRTDYYLGQAAKIEGDLKTAFHHWNHMVEEYPNDWCAWSVLGDCLAYCCRYDEASACYQKSMDIQPEPRYMDNPVAMAQIAEIQGDYAKAIHMREVCIAMTQTEWKVTEGEWLDTHRREIARLRKKQNEKH